MKTLEEKLNAFLQLVGNENRYQILLLTLSFFNWMSLQMICASLALLEAMPTVSYFDEQIKAYAVGTLNYSICKQGNYTVVSSVGHSIVIDFDIMCNKYLTGLVSSSVMLGLFIADLLLETITKAFGRKRAAILFGITDSIFILTILLTPFLGNFKVYYLYFYLFMVNFLCEVSNQSLYILTTESFSISKRTLAGNLVTSAYSISGVVSTLILYSFNSWKAMILISAPLGLLVNLISMVYIVESPLYYISRKEIHYFMLSLREIAKKNDRVNLYDFKVDYPQILYEMEDSDEFLQSRKIFYEEEEEKWKESIQFLLPTYQYKSFIHELKNEENKIFFEKLKGNSKYTFIYLLKLKSQRLTFFTLCFLWFTVGGIYYALSVGLKNLPGTMYSNSILVYSIEFGATIGIIYVINIHCLGRKYTFLLLIIISFFSLISNFFFNFHGILEIILSFVGRISILAYFNSLFIYTVEMYPTPLRTMGFGYNSICARISSISIPFLAEVMGKNIFYVYGVIIFICFLGQCTLKETLGLPLPEQIPEEKKCADS